MSSHQIYENLAEFNFYTAIERLVVFGSFLLWVSCSSSVVVEDQWNGVSYVAPPREEPTNPFPALDSLHANAVCLMPYAFCNPESPEVQYNHPRQWWGERSEGLIASIAMARQCSLQIMVKPHLWVRGQGWTGDFTLDTETDWQVWERSYERYMLEMAAIADSLEVELFCMGLEFKNAIAQRPTFWRQLIQKVRKVYRGKLTYGANWDNFDNIPFWDELDYIGIHAYFPLSQADTPTLKALQSAWINHKQRLQKLSEMHKKPVLFTEFGYRSIDGAAGNQWELPSEYEESGKINLLAQQVAYEAFFLQFWQEPWVAGGFLWKWYGAHRRFPHAENTRYTPQGKPAANVVRQWYKKE